MSVLHVVLLLTTLLFVGTVTAGLTELGMDPRGSFALGVFAAVLAFSTREGKP